MVLATWYCILTANSGYKSDKTDCFEYIMII